MKNSGAGLGSYLGCGCMAAAVLLAALGGLAVFLWRPAAGPAAAPSPPVWRARWEAEQARTFEEIRRERNAAVARGERTVMSGRLAPGRDVSLRCDDTLTIEVKAGTFASEQPVQVRAFEVGEGLLPPTVEPLAAYDVKIGAGGPLRQPLLLRVQHPPVEESDALRALRWDEETANWIPLPSLRRSPTLTLVRADHLSRILVTRARLSSWERYQIDDSAIVIWIRAGFVPDIEKLFARRGDEDRLPPGLGRAAGEMQLHWRRFMEQADARGFTDLSQPDPRQRDTPGVRRRYLAAVIHAMATRVAAAYRGRLNDRFDIYVGRFDEPSWAWAWNGVHLPENQGLESPEALALNLGHELFHGGQVHSGMNVAWMWYSLWLTEATAEYTSARVAWADLGSNPFDELGVQIDARQLHALMGSGITPTFLREPLSSAGVKKERAYLSAHFLEFLLRRTGLGFDELWAQLRSADATERDEVVLAKLCRRAGVPFEDVYRDFAAWLVLDADSPARAAPAAASGDAPAPTPVPGTTEWDGVVFLDVGRPSHRETLALAPGTLGHHLVLAAGVSVRDPAPQSLTLSFEGTRGGAQIEVFKTSRARPHLSGTSPLRRLSTFERGPVTLVYSLNLSERVHVIATRAGGAEPQLSVTATLGGAALRASPIGPGRFRLELAGIGADAAGRVEWAFGDGGREDTRTAAVEHTWPRPGTYEARATVFDPLSDQVTGEFVGRVEVASALRLVVVDKASGTPLPRASARLRYERTSSSRSADGAGVALFETVPPRALPVAIDVSASGFEGFYGEATFDFRQRLVVEITIPLTRRISGGVATTTTTTPPLPPAEPRPEPEPEPPAPVPTTPASSRHYDEAAALAAWRAAFEAKYQGIDRVQNFTLEYRLEWVTPPTIRNGQVLVNYRLLKKRRFDDGREDAWFEENAAQSAPFVITTVAELQRTYPQFWRQGPASSSQPRPSAPEEPRAPTSLPRTSPPSRPAERQYDGAGALSAYVADFEARYRGTDRVEGGTVEYRVEWVTRPFIQGGQVMGDYRLFRLKRYLDGRAEPPFEEHPAYGAPVLMTTVAKLQEKYPQFWRR